MFVAIQLTIQTCTSLLRWRLNLALQVSLGSASTCFRWSGHFRHCFVKGLFWDTLSNFYWNLLIFDREGAKNKLAQFFWDNVYLQKLESLAYIFVAACIGLSSFKFEQWAPKHASFLRAPEWVLAVQGHPRSMILVPIESAYATSY